MKLMLDLSVAPLNQKIEYTHNIMLVGSCFTEHIGNRLIDSKFSVIQNPNGILFDPISVCNSLISYIEPKEYKQDDLFHLHELWQSWDHHTQFSGIDPDHVIEKINRSQKEAHAFLKKADWLMITLGSSFSYRLAAGGRPVANCHRAPGQWFNKHLLTIDETLSALDNCMHQLFQFNPKLQIIFTISPVRHIRDGVIENNRSKARLIEAVHHLVNKFDKLYYFPAYEILIDVLRDYRFYDIDLVHPNYAATEFVFNKFTESYIEANALELMEDVKKIVTAYRHKPFQPETKAHKSFLMAFAEKAQLMQQKLPNIDLSKEITYFNEGI